MEHYFSEKQSSPLRKKEIKVVVRGMELTCITGSGTFSTRDVDNGTEALITHAQIVPGQRVLDLGCGWGVVGIVCAKLGCIVTMTDINTRATQLAKENLKKNNVQAIVVQGDRYEKVEGYFDVILVNPPHTAGRDLCYSMIDQAQQYLVTGGSLQLVARHQKGGKMLQKRMEENFGNSIILGRMNGFTVYCSKKMDDMKIAKDKSE